MPNWCETKLVITGEQEALDELREQLRRPYPAPHSDKTIKEEITGEFLLWNIVRPIDLDASLEVKSEKPASPDKDFSDFVEEMNKKIAEENSWYYWNIRNWGTKWEINDAGVSVEPNRLEYYFMTAWSPVEAAITNLAKQYPTLTMTMRAVDEGGMFACEIHWDKGEQVFDTDIPYNHALQVEMYGECWACSDPDTDPETRKDLGCPDDDEIVVPDTIEGLV
jgi:hypothetical protein